jgi:hypothetical protein
LCSDKNCIESSTAIGFCIEEFIVTKLIDYTNTKKSIIYKVNKDQNSTTKSSYDCYSNLLDKSKCLINIKADKKNNDAVAAINALYNDYVKTKPNIDKHFMVLKINYEISHAKSKKKSGEKCIHILNIESYFLEEISFIHGYFSDSRN